MFTFFCLCMPRHRRIHPNNLIYWQLPCAIVVLAFFLAGISLLSSGSMLGGGGLAIVCVMLTEWVPLRRGRLAFAAANLKVTRAAIGVAGVRLDGL